MILEASCNWNKPFSSRCYYYKSESISLHILSKGDWDFLGDIGGLDMLIWEGKGGSGGGWSSIYIWDKVDNNAWEVESVFFGG